MIPFLLRLAFMIISPLLRKRGYKLHIGSISWNRFKNLTLKYKTVIIKIGCIRFKRFAFSLSKDKIKIECGLNGVEVYRKERLRASIERMEADIKFSSLQYYSVEVNFPNIKVLNLNIDKDELYIKSVLSKQDLYNILPNNNLFHQYVNSLLAEQITILAYYNNHEVKPMPLVNYQISGLEQYDNWQPDSISLKTLILSKLKSKGHLASEYVTYDNIPYLVKATLIACEDPAFMCHTGVCPYAFGLIFKTLFDGRLPNGGGSTLTQQLIKNAFFTEDISIDRKVKDAITSLIAERIFHLSKHDILEIYLNMAEFGIGICGITPASKYYFDKDINNLSPVEVLVLMYILPRPKFFEEALINDSTQLRQNLKRYILNNIGRLKQMNIIDNYPPLPLADVSFPGVNASLCLDITDWCNEDNL